MVWSQTDRSAFPHYPAVSPVLQIKDKNNSKHWKKNIISLDVTGKVNKEMLTVPQPQKSQSSGELTNKIYVINMLKICKGNIVWKIVTQC